MNSFQHNIPVTGGGQATYEQCWLACYQMVLRPSGKDTSIESKLRAGLKTNVAGQDKYDDALKNGLADTDYDTCAKTLGLKSWAGTSFNKAKGFFDIGLSDGAEAFLKELQRGPRWVSRFINKDLFRIVLATGYKDDDDGLIIFNNPFPGPKGAVRVSNIKAN